MRERMVLPFSLQLEECSFYLFKTRLFIAVSHFIAKLPFQQLSNLKIRSLLKIKESLRPCKGERQFIGLNLRKRFFGEWDGFKAFLFGAL